MVEKAPHGFYVHDKGRVMHVLGDEDMSPETLGALTRMMHAAYDMIEGRCPKCKGMGAIGVDGVCVKCGEPLSKEE